MSKLIEWMKYGLRWGTPLPRQPVSGYLEWTLLRDILQAYSIDCVLDVGANTGQFARNLRRVGYQGHICSFEPVKEAYTFLSASFREDARWAGYNYALGSENTQRTFHVTVESTAMSSFLQPQDAGWKLREAVVEIKRLDGVFQDVVVATGLKHPRVFLKMDTQGYDLEVFNGAGHCLDLILGLQSEVSVKPVYEGMPHYLDSIRTFEDHGFELHGLAEVFRHPLRNHLIEMNCVMMRPIG
ncbi:MAG: FkbM family methyltransferase [Anaerolineales bacterium]|nr:FkbM family methyltransferase [Anaerolineales bacterium]